MVKSGISTISFIVCLMAVSNRIVVVAQKLDAAIDLVFLWPGAMKNDMPQLKDYVLNLPNVFEMSESKVKIAVFDLYDLKIARSFTSDETVFKDWVNSWSLTGSSRVVTQNYYKALGSIRNVFANSGGSRAKLVITAVIDRTYNFEQAKKESDKLRNDGAWLYALVGAVYDTDKDWINYMTGHTTRVVVNSFRKDGQAMESVDKLSQLLDVMRRDLCNWITACCYKKPNQKECKADLVQFPVPPYFTDDHAQCDSDTVKPKFPANITCDDDKCKNECDRQWPWDQQCVDSICVYKKRVNPPRMMENCLETEACPACITSTTSTTTTTKTSTASTPKKESFPWMIIGLVIGIIVALIIALALIIVFVKKKKPATRAATRKMVGRGSKSVVIPSKVVVAKMPPPPPVVVKNASIMSMGKDASFVGAMARGRKGAEASVAADLLDKSVMKLGGKSTLGKKIETTSTKSKLESIKKSVKVIKK